MRQRRVGEGNMGSGKNMGVDPRAEEVRDQLGCSLHLSRVVCESKCRGDIPGPVQHQVEVWRLDYLWP